MKLNRSGISTLLVVSVVVMLVAVAAIGTVLFITSNTNDNKNDNTDDTPKEAIIQGRMAAGTIFRFNQVVGESGYGPMPETFSDITVTIIGQGPIYYLAKVEFKWDTSYDTSFIIEIHKNTGELKYATKIGTDSMQYGGKTVQLDKWELRLPLSVMTFSIDPQESIPYKFQIDSDYYGSFSFSTDLSSMTKIEEQGQYVKPNEVGKGMTYRVDRSPEGIGTVTCKIVGERTYPASERGWVFCSFVDVRAGINAYYSTLGPNDGVGDILMLSTVMYSVDAVEKGAIPVTEEKISTIDGDVMCDVYELNMSTKYTIHIGQKNSVVYRIETSHGYKYSLSGRI